ncbi:MAG: type II secretion system F family protein [Patescibacteria group bacterium]
MPIYSYQVKKPGATKTTRGELHAESLPEANKALRAQGYTVLQIVLFDEKSSSPFHFSLKRTKVPLKEKIIFSRQLSVMTKAGLSIVKALESLSRQTNNKHFQEVIHDLIEQVKGGTVLSIAMSRHPKIFADIYVAVIRAGEQTGQLSDVLLNLADQQEKEADLIGKVKGAMIYPAIIFCLLIAVLILIVVFVIPSLQSIFTESGTTLPLSTRMLLGLSQVIRGYYWIIVPALVGLYLLLKLWVGTPSGREVYDKAKFSLPIFGTLTKKVYMARFARTMAMLIKASLPILESLEIIRKTISNIHYNRAFERIQREVESGKTMSGAVSKEKLFPPMVSQLISLGEESGSMESVLLDVASFYDKEVDTMSKNLTTLLEPIMLIVMGVGIGFVVSSVLGPIYGLVNAF